MKLLRGYQLDRFDIYTQSPSQYSQHRKILLLLVFYGQRSGGTDRSSLICPGPPVESTACYLSLCYSFLSQYFTVLDYNLDLPSNGNGHLVIEGPASLWRESSNLTEHKRRKILVENGDLPPQKPFPYTKLQFTVHFSPKSACLHNFMHYQVLSSSFKFCLPFTLH